MSRWALGLTLIATAAMGVALRLDLASGAVTGVGIDFANLRHAHSHLGFYGFLTLGWWLVLRDLKPMWVPRWLPPLHLGVVALATLWFATSGYVVATIALSTLVASSWLYVAWRSRGVPGWVGLARWGVLAGTLLVPAIAVMARRDFQLSRQLAHVFVALMVLWVFVPVSLSALKVPVMGRYGWLLTTAIGSSYLVFADTWPWPLGLFLSLAGAQLGLAIRTTSRTWPRHLALAWWAMAMGLIALGLVPPLHLEATRLAALHFTVLGPIALTLLHRVAPDREASRLRRQGLLYPGLFALVTMVTAMVLGPLGAIPFDLAMDVALYAGAGILTAIMGVSLPLRRAGG